MSGETVVRRLAAIFVADAVGYSRLMGADELATHRQFKADLAGLLAPGIASRHGRVVKTTGDGLLAEFASVVDAVECAAQVQRSIAERNAGIPAESRLAYRIGINLGDIIIESDDIYGDGVNVAVRIEALAEPGGVCISGDAFRQLRGKSSIAFRDLGEQRLKNIAEPVRVYRLDNGQGSRMLLPLLAGAERLRSVDRPSIAVLPFENLSGSAGDSYFSDGITEDIITELSRFRSLFVIARNSSFQFRGRPVDLKRVGEELGVRYVLEGSVRRAGRQTRITAQLIDSQTGHHVWAERYDRDAEDVFAVQDEVARSIVGRLVPRLEHAELTIMKRKPPSNWQAYDYWLRGAECQELGTQADYAEARLYHDKAIEIDPGFARAYASLAEIQFMETVFSGWGVPRDEAYGKAFALAQRAVQLDPADALPHTVLGWVHMIRREFERARKHWDIAATLNPNDADNMMSRATALAFFGEAAAGIESGQMAVRLNPLYPDWYLSDLAVALFMARRYDEAAAMYDAIPELYPHTPAWKAATFALLGRAGEAARSAEAFVRNIRAIWVGDEAAGPADYTRWLLNLLPIRRAEDIEHFRGALVKAGLPA